MKSKILFSLAAAAVVAVIAPDASACREGLNPWQAQGRNAWASMWGYITPDKEMELNAQGRYVEFSNGCYQLTIGGTCSIKVPINMSGTFVPGLMMGNFCATSDCYTPDQKIQMGGEYVGIEDVANLESRTLTTLAAEATVENPMTLEQPIAAISWASGAQEIYVLEGAEGERIEVTGGHPMVLADGTIRVAKELKEGDTLAGEKGAIIALARIGTYKYDGKVWNIKPESEKKTENIVIAEGFLAGSMRFQDQWAHEKFRLFVRDAVKVDKLLSTKK